MSSVISFSKRHKKKLIFSVVFFGGGYLAIQYAARRFKDALMYSSNAASMINQRYLVARKHEHYLTIKQTSDEAIIELVKSIQDQINKNLSCDGLLEQLKQKPPNKLEIWEKMKVLCMAKCLTTIYSMSIMSIFVKIELNIIGAYLFTSNSIDNSFTNFDENSLEMLNNQNLKLSAYCQQKYLENIENFVKEGLTKLSKKIQECCEQVFGEVSLKENIDIEFLSTKFELIRQKIEQKIDEEKMFVFNYMSLNLEDSDLEVLKPNNNKFKTDDEVLKQLNLETYDLINSNDFEFTLKSLVNYLKNEFLNNLTSLMVKQIVSVEKSEKITIAMPFAKLIPILDKSQFLFDSNSSIYNVLLKDLKLNIFSANIYEAFSNLPESKTTDSLANGIDLNLILKSVI